MMNALEHVAVALLILIEIEVDTLLVEKLSEVH